MRKIKVIFATGMNGEFSKDGEMPWGKKPLAGDAEHFQTFTRGQVVVMGSGTWNSLPKHLAGRINVVLSSVESNLDISIDKTPHMVMKGDLDQIIPEIQMNYPNKDIIIIGGMALIKEGLKIADEVSWTISDFSYAGCTSVNSKDLRKKLYENGLKFYSHTRINNEGFGLGENCDITFYKKVK